MEQKGNASNLDTQGQQGNGASVDFSEQDISNGELGMNSSQNGTKVTMQPFPSDSCGSLCDSNSNSIPDNDDSNIRYGSDDTYEGPQNNQVTQHFQNGNVTMSTNSVENTDMKTSGLDSADTDTENENCFGAPEAVEQVNHLDGSDANEDLEDDANEYNKLEDDVEGDELDQGTEDENVNDDTKELEAIPANRSSRNDYDLLGPQRRRHETRQQRREAANPVSSYEVEIAIPLALAEQWREIGFQWGLDNDNDIARMLLQHYEDVQAGRPPRPPPDPRCRGCRGRMRLLSCHQCGPKQHHVRFDKDEDKGGGGSGGDGGFSGGGRDGFCGSCRD